MFFTQSRANETLIYKVEPAIVAEACQTALKQLGHVKKVSRETGTIAGTIGFFGVVFVNLRISGHADGSELHIQMEAKEGMLTQGRAQKGLTEFLTTLGKDRRLDGAATGGW